jgi:hypothetical protein
VTSSGSVRREQENPGPEFATTERWPTMEWRKSSCSGGGQGNCVEVAFKPKRVAVRDSKNTAGPVLAFPSAHWRAFVASARRV